MAASLAAVTIQYTTTPLHVSTHDTLIFASAAVCHGFSLRETRCSDMRSAPLHLRERADVQTGVVQPEILCLTSN
jgi:hypothetical protein